MSINDKGSVGELIWVIRPWIITSLVEETVMVFIVFIASFLVEVYFGSAYFLILGISFIDLTILVLSLIWLINASHLLLVRSSNRYTLRKKELEIEEGIVRKRSSIISQSNYSGLVVRQSIVGTLLGSGEIIVWRSDEVRENRLSRVRNPFKLAENIKSVLSQ